jgi:hypothetical protein
MMEGWSCKDSKDIHIPNMKGLPQSDDGGRQGSKNQKIFKKTGRKQTSCDQPNQELKSANVMSVRMQGNRDAC